MYSDLKMSCLVKFPGFLSVPNATTMRFPTSYTKRLVPSKVSYVSEPGGCFLLGGLRFFPLGAQMSQHVQTTVLHTTTKRLVIEDPRYRLQSRPTLFAMTTCVPFLRVAILFVSSSCDFFCFPPGVYRPRPRPRPPPPPRPRPRMPPRPRGPPRSATSLRALFLGLGASSMSSVSSGSESGRM